MIAKLAGHHIKNFQCKIFVSTMKNGSIIELRKLANLKVNSSSSNFPVLEIQILLTLVLWSSQ